MRELAGHPLMAYTICAARQAGIFTSVIVSTDSAEYRDLARRYGAEVPFLRPEPMASSTSPDIEWVTHALSWLRNHDRLPDAFAILRPTSPFRLPQSIRRAWEHFLGSQWPCDSLRAVQKCSEHPGKMWVVHGEKLIPVLPVGPQDPPWHSRQYQSLPSVFVQNASLEIAWASTVLDKGSIAGTEILPLISEGYEGFDINAPLDFLLAELMVERQLAELPKIDIVC